VTVGNDGTARRWAAGTGTVLRLQSAGGPAVNAVVGGPDGHTVLTAGEDGLARLWDARTAREIDDHAQCGLPASALLSCLSMGLLNHQLTFMTAADLSPDGRLVATGGADGTAFVYDAHSGRMVAQLKGDHGRVEGVAFSPDGRRVATAAGDGTARVWDVADGHPIAVMRGHASVDGPVGPDRSVNAVAFLPDGRRIATGGADGTVRLWDAASGRELRVFRVTSDSILEVAASPDGRYLAAPFDETARVWDAATGRTVANLTDHDGLVYSVGFSPDSRALVTGGQDLTARIWEIPSGRPLGVLRGHTASLETSRFSADGRTILTGADDGTARVFPCDACGSPEQLIERARARVTRALTAAERRRFLS
jgi:WD40 repeat protein